MAKYRCPDCGYTYDETAGDAHEGLTPGTTWEQVPDNWNCPDCAVRSKPDFVLVGEGPEQAAPAIDPATRMTASAAPEQVGREFEAVRSNQVREGVILTTMVAGQAVALTRVDGELRAFSPKCPHLGMPLGRGRVAHGTITCPFHGARFDLRTGENVQWANALLRLSMPSWTHGMLAMGRKPAALKMFPASEREGAVFVQIG